MDYEKKDGVDASSVYTQKQIKGDENPLELIKKFELWFEEAKPLTEKRKQWCDKNMNSYLGVPNKKPFERASYKSNTNHNKQYENVETIVPIMTESVPEPIAAVFSNDDEIFQAAQKVENVLKYNHRVDRMQTKSESIARNMVIHRDAVVSPVWDKTLGSDGDVTIEIIDPKYFYVDPNSTYERQGDYFFKCVPRSYRWAVKHFPNKTKELRSKYGVDTYSDTMNTTYERPDDINADSNETLLPIKEVWYRREMDGDFVIYRAVYVGDCILSHDINPYWDHIGMYPPEIQMKMEKEISMFAENVMLKEGREINDLDVEAIKKRYKKEKIYYNFLEKEEFPYIIFPTFIDYNSPFSRTSPIEQTELLQISLTKRKQQIDENANLTANAQWVIDEDAGVDTHSVNNAPGAIYKKRPGSEMRREPGVPLPSYVIEDMNGSEEAIDNIWGANSISKGQVSTAKTAAEATILKQADEGRVALLMRHFYESMERVYQWQAHLMKLFYTEDRKFALFNASGGTDAWDTITNDQIPDDMQIFVKVGAARPRDTLTRRLEADALYAQGALDPITYYELRGDIKDPYAAAERLDKWKKGMLFEEKPVGVEEAAHIENRKILESKPYETIQPHESPNPAHIMIHLELMQDKSIPLTDKQMEKLEFVVGNEIQAIQGAKQEEATKAAQAPMPLDIASLDPDAVPDNQVENVVAQMDQHEQMEQQGMQNMSPEMEQQEEMQEQMPNDLTGIL